MTALAPDMYITAHPHHLLKRQYFPRFSFWVLETRTLSVCLGISYQVATGFVLVMVVIFCEKIWKRYLCYRGKWTFDSLISIVRRLEFGVIDPTLCVRLGISYQVATGFVLVMVVIFCEKISKRFSCYRGKWTFDLLIYIVRRLELGVRDSHYWRTSWYFGSSCDRFCSRGGGEILWQIFKEILVLLCKLNFRFVNFCR